MDDYYTILPSFQSTPPRGGRPLRTLDSVRSLSISIHAPARGATSSALAVSCVSCYFNPRPREGGDWSSLSSTLFMTHFNPRPREGGDMSRPALSSGISYFNPRPREGGDSKDAQFYLRIFDKQVELLRFWGKMRGGCLRNPEKDRRFLGKSLANLPEISGHLDFAGA